MAAIIRLSCLGLLAAIGQTMAAATTPAAGPRIAPRILQEGVTDIAVATPSGGEIMVEVADESYEVVLPTTEDHPEETRVTIEKGGAITTVTIGSNIYEVFYDDNGDVAGVSPMPAGAAARRTQEEDVPHRLLQGTSATEEDIPEETRVTVDEDGEITTVAVGLDMFKAFHDDEDTVAGVTTVPEDATRRRTQEGDVPHRRMQASCEEFCVAVASEVHDTLADGCADRTGLGSLLGDLFCGDLYAPGDADGLHEACASVCGTAH